MQDHAQHNEVLQHRERAQGECQDGDGELLTRSQNHKALHVVGKVLPARWRSSAIHRRAVSEQKVGHVGGEDGREASVEVLLISRDKCRERVGDGGGERFLKVGLALDQGRVDGGVVVAGIVGAEILDTCC